MSVAGILTSAAFSIRAQVFQSRRQKVKQEFHQLGQDLQSGNLAAAQSDFAKLRQDFQAQSTQGHHLHHHHQSGASSSDSSTAISQLFSQIGSALQSGNLTAAQQAYSTMLQNSQQVGQFAALPSLSGSTGISVNVYSC